MLLHLLSLSWNQGIRKALEFYLESSLVVKESRNTPKAHAKHEGDWKQENTNTPVLGFLVQFLEGSAVGGITLMTLK